MAGIHATSRKGPFKRRDGEPDVILVAPHFDGARYVKSLATSPPLGLITTATVLNNEGIATEVLNLSAFPDSDSAYYQFARRLGRLRPSGIVGVSMNITELRRGAHLLIKLSKSLRPDAKIVCGGIHATHCRRLLMKNFDVDYILLGEVERRIADFAKTALNGGGECGLPGVVTRGNFEENHMVPVADPLGSLPIPDYGVVNLERQKALNARPLEEYDLSEMKLEDGLPVESSRGCPFQCDFCGIGDRRLRAYPSSHVCGAIEKLHRKHGFTAFTFIDDIFTFSKERTLELCGGLKEMNLPMTWAAQTRADYADPDLLRAMKEAGCRIVAFGVESGSEAIQRRIGKNLETEKIMDAAENARKAGLMVQTFFLLGHPGETEEDVKRTVGMVRNIRPEHFCLDVVKVFPGAKLYDELKERNLISDDFWMNDENAMPTYSGMCGGEISEKRLLEVEYAWLEAADKPPARVLRDFLSERFEPGKEIFEGGVLQRFFRGREGCDHIVVECGGEAFRFSVSYSKNEDGSLKVFIAGEPFIECENPRRLEIVRRRLNGVLMEPSLHKGRVPAM